MSSSAIDLDHLRQYTQGDPALELEVFALFREQCALWLRALDPSGDAESWRAACHALKGTARGVGAFAMAEACATAEALAGDAGTSVARSVAFEDLRRASDDALAAVARLEQKAGSAFRGR